MGGTRRALRWRGLAPVVVVGAVVAGVLVPATSSSGRAGGPDSGRVGRWSALEPYPVVPVSAAMLPDGRIVAWDQADAANTFGAVDKSGPAMILDPVSGTVTRSANVAPRSTFCSLIATLPDGRVTLIGGGSGMNERAVQVFDPATSSFSLASSELTAPRWYPGGTVDARGNIVAIGGAGGDGGDVIDGRTLATRRLAIPYGSNWYPNVFRMPDGRFFVEDVTEVGRRRLGRYVLDARGAGGLAEVGDRSLLEPRRRNSRAAVGPMQHLLFGGGRERSSYVVDLSSGTPQFRRSGDMAYPRTVGTGVTMADGSVLAVGGNSSGNLLVDLQASVLEPERWDPASGQWSVMAPMGRARQYHSVSMLLPDGRVWVAGGSWKEGYQERNGQYFSPPYLFRTDGSGRPAPRPQVRWAPTAMGWGETVTVVTPQARRIARVHLVRMGGTTHQFTFDEAFVPLAATAVSDTEVRFTVPRNGNLAPVGRYMVFLVDADGVPSVAPIVELRDAPVGQRPVQQGTADLTGAVATQSSTSWAGAAARALDGNTSGVWASNTITHTAYERQPWWGLDLGGRRDVAAVTVHQRTDACCIRRLDGAVLLVSDRPFTGRTLAELRREQGVDVIPLGDRPGASVRVEVGRSARFLRVQLPGEGYLSLAEVQVHTG